MTLNLKGLELQETTCHSLEATRVDNIFEAAFEKRALVNGFPFHSLTPLTQAKLIELKDGASEQVEDKMLSHQCKKGKGGGGLSSRAEPCGGD